MKREWKPGFAVLWGGVLLGSMQVACGPVPEEGGTEAEEGGTEAVDAAQVEEVRSADAVAPTPQGAVDAPVPTALARYGPAVAYGGGKYSALPLTQEP